MQTLENKIASLEAELEESRQELDRLSRDLEYKSNIIEAQTQELNAAYKKISQNAEELQVSYMNTSVLSKIGQELTATLDFEQIFEKLYNYINYIMDAAVFCVFLYHEDEQTVEGSFLLEKSVRLPKAKVSMEEERPVVWCIKNRKEVVVNDLDRDMPKYFNNATRKVIAGEMPESILYFPMMIEDRVIGAITTQSFRPNAYTTYHLDIIRSLASYTAIALDNARSYKAIEESHQAMSQQQAALEEAYREIREQQEEITDSIRYAKRIQEALLPDINHIKEVLPHSFILYKSRDIVSGDFYWFTTTGGRIILAAVDCTGHGVPGAFMAVLGSTMLDEIVNDKGVIEPDMILEDLHLNLQQRLKQLNPGSSSNDGMDIAICSLDRTNRVLHYAGAHNPLYLIQEGQLKVVKADRNPVGGGLYKALQYNCHSFALNAGDSFYIFTDGYADQFGGPRGKKFKYSNLQKLFLEIHSQTPDAQCQKLDEVIEEWKGDLEQTDDILVIGVRV